MDRLGGTFGSHETAQDAVDWDAHEVHDDHEVDDTPPSPVGQDERRMQVRAYNHWAGLLGNANFPLIDYLEPGSLDDFGPYSVLLDFGTGLEDPAVRYLGAQLAAECSADEGIDKLSDVPSRSLLSRITDHYMQILANQAPIGFEAEFVNGRGNTALYRGILLPYSSDGKTIDFIYGVINWKEVADCRTADDLLLEIGQSLDDKPQQDSDHEELQDEVVQLAASAAEKGSRDMEKPFDRDDDERRVERDTDDVLDLGVEGKEIDTPVALPTPAFGAAPEPSVPTARGPKVPASMMPGGGDFADEWGDEDYDYEDDDDSIGETAKDYGLDDDWEEPAYEDVDDVVDPLADESVGIGLSALVTRGTKSRPQVELPSALDQDDAEPGEESTAPAMPRAYEPEVTVPFARAPVIESEDPIGEEDDVLDLSGEHFAPVEDSVEDDGAQQDFDVPADKAVEIAAVVEDVPADAYDDDYLDDEDEDEDSPEGLYDCLAAARESAQMARIDEDRSRKALYQAVGRAYDFSLEAEAAPEDFAELIADNGLTVQDRAPMTPIVKLVFGSDYDKTRITEYAAVLSHAHRLDIERGTLAGFLASAEGGLKGVVQAERRARKEEAGKPVEDEDTVREALAKKLREIDPVALEDLPLDGPEFALVMIRRTPEGELVVVGEVPEDLALVERAGRKLVD